MLTICKRNHDTSLTGLTATGRCRLCANTTGREYAKKNPAKILNVQLKHHYKISLEDYNRIFQEQNGLCAGCFRHQVHFQRRLAVDHNHLTGKVRGLLCNSCNRGLGYLKENPDILIRLADYLIKRGI